MDHFKICHHARVSQHAYLSDNKYFFHLIVNRNSDQIVLSLLASFQDQFHSSDLTSFILPNQRFSFEQMIMISSFLLHSSHFAVVR